MNGKRLGGAALIVAGGFLGREFLVWLFGKFLDAISTGVRGGLTFATLSWQNAAAVVLVIVGLTLVIFPRSPTPKSTDATSSSRSVAHLCNLGNNIVGRVRTHRMAHWFEREELEPVTDIAKAGFAALLTYDKAGYSVPRLDQQYAQNVCVGLESYFSDIIQYLAQGHEAEARELSEVCAKRAEETASMFDAERWFQRIA